MKSRICVTFIVQDIGSKRFGIILSCSCQMRKEHLTLRKILLKRAKDAALRRARARPPVDSDDWNNSVQGAWWSQNRP